MTTNITVESYVLLLLAEQMSSIRKFNSRTAEEAFRFTAPIARIFCVDGTSISVQAHAGAHCRYEDIPTDGMYSHSFGSKLSIVETDSDDLDKYGCDTMECVELYVESHGGIDFIKTSEEAVKRALR